MGDRRQSAEPADVDTLVLCPVPQMRVALERALHEAGCRVRLVLDTPAFRACLAVIPESTRVVLVALARDALVQELLDELARNGRAVAMIVSPQTPPALADHPNVVASLSIPYDDAQLAQFARDLVQSRSWPTQAPSARGAERQ